jgi:Gas vesicle synthesis protein GvpL/GvpF
MSLLYVYAVTREAVTPEVEGVDGSRRFGAAMVDGVAAIFTLVAEEEMSQEAIDRRSGDLEWLGAMGYRHQSVVAALMNETAIVPLRAFTLFRSEESLRAFLREEREMLASALDRLDEKREWTVRIEIDPERWSASLGSRVESLGWLEREIGAAAPGKAFLLRKKLEEEKKRASRAAEEGLVAEIEKVVVERLHCETVAESREHRQGAFPQITVLIDRDEEAKLQELRDQLGARYEREGVTIALTGPWPPYSFASV